MEVVVIFQTLQLFKAVCWTEVLLQMFKQEYTGIKAFWFQFKKIVQKQCYYFTAWMLELNIVAVKRDHKILLNSILFI